MQHLKDQNTSSMNLQSALDVFLVMHDIDMRDDPNFQNTPERWTRYLLEFLQPFEASEVLSVTFPPTNPGFNPMVVQGDIPYRAVCAHHLVPVLGHAHVGYIPNTKIVGLSKLSRLVWGITHRKPSLQEAVCDEIVDSLCQYLELGSAEDSPSGAMCVIVAEHGCMACRGIAEPGVNTGMSSVRGAFRYRPEARAEFFALVNMTKK